MKNTKLVQICFLLASLLALPTSLFAQQANDVQLAQRLAGSILVGGHSMQTLQSLTDTFGPRLTGSATYTGATEWAATQFRSYGIQSEVRPARALSPPYRKICTPLPLDGSLRLRPAACAVRLFSSKTSRLRPSRRRLLSSRARSCCSTAPRFTPSALTKMRP